MFEKLIIEVSNSLFRIILPSTEEKENEEDLDGFLETGRRFTRKEFQDAPNLNKSAAVSKLSGLTKEGKISKEGNGPNTRYLSL